MMDIQLPELDERPLTMIPEAKVRLLGPGPEDPSTALAGRLRLGGPLAIPISAGYAANDADLHAFVVREAPRYRYHLVHLALTAASEPGDPRLERVSIQLALSATRAGVEVPIAWSMTPTRITDVSQLSVAWRLGPQVKLVDMEASIGSVEHTSTRTNTQLYLEAFNELRADPAWELRRTRGLEIRGGHRLALVVRTPVRMETRLDGTVHATVARGPRPWRAKARIPDVLSLSASM